ncbi:MAG: TonB-dependent receptor [Pseudomonadota bacterium]
MISFDAANAWALCFGIAVFLSTSSHAQDGNKELFELSLDELLDVEVVSVSKRAESIFDAPAAIFVVTAEDIRRSGAMNIPEALRLAPGIDVAQIDSNKWAISTRGYNQRFSNKLLVLMDGRPIYSPVFSGVFWDSQDTLLEDIERIEVIRGPGATLWGANAVNGVVNIISKASNDTQGTLVSAVVGNQERGTIAARYGGGLGDLGAYRVYGKFFERAENELASGVDGADDWRQARLGLRADLNLTPDDNLFLDATVFDSTVGESAYQLSFEEPFRELVERDQLVEGSSLLLRWDRQLAAGSSFSFQAFVDESEREWAIANIDRSTFDLSAEYRAPSLERHNLLFGTGYRLNDDVFSPGSSNRIEVFPRQRDEEVFNFFVQDEITIVPDKWHLTLGSKFEYNDFTGWEVQPNLRVLFRPASNTSFWGSISRAVRTPGRADRDYQLFFDVLPAVGANTPPTAIAVSGTRDFDSEKLLAYEAGLKLRPFSHLSLDLAFFYFDYEENRGYRIGPTRCLPTGAALPACLADPSTFAIGTGLFQANNSIAESYGMELSADWRPSSDWRFQTNLSLFGGEEESVAGVGLVTNDSLMTSPEVQASLRLGYLPASNWELDIWLRYVGEIFSLDGVPIDAYTTADIRAAWSPSKRFELAFVAKNILSEGRAQFLSQPVDIPLMEIQSSFAAQIRLTF